jgi:hypothetical protein
MNSIRNLFNSTNLSVGLFILSIAAIVLGGNAGSVWG